MLDSDMIEARLHSIASETEGQGSTGQFDLGFEQFDTFSAPPIGGDGIQQFVPTRNDDQIKIGQGVVCIGRKHYKVSGISAEGGAEYRLKIVLGGLESNKISIEKGSGFEDPVDETSYIPLYKLGNEGEIIEDYRSNFCVVARD